MSLADDLATEPAGNPPPATGRTWDSVSDLYQCALLIAEMRVTASADRLGVKATLADVLQATATIFIDVSKHGVRPSTVRLPPLKDSHGV